MTGGFLAHPSHRIGGTAVARAVLALLGTLALTVLGGVTTTSVAATGTATIVGHVVGINEDPDASLNGPLSGATVTVVEARSGRVVGVGVSDALGRYEITSLPKARVSVHITKEGFLGVWSDNQKSASTATVYQLNRGQTREITPEQVLWAEAVISGQVLETFDPPTDPVRVEVFDADTHTLLGVVDVPPGDGQYRIGGLPAGPIKVVATPLAGLWADSWADGAASWDAATVFTLYPGQHLTQSWSPTKVLYLDLVYAGEVKGTVVKGNGRPIEGSSVTVLDTAGNVLAQGRSDSAGSYRLRFQDWAGLQVKVMAAKAGWATVYANGKTSFGTADVIVVDGHQSVTLAPLVLTRR